MSYRGNGSKAVPEFSRFNKKRTCIRHNSMMEHCYFCVLENMEHVIVQDKLNMLSVIADYLKHQDENVIDSVTMKHRLSLKLSQLRNAMKCQLAKMKVNEKYDEEKS